VIHDTTERVKLMNSFGRLAVYARMGAGIPLLNTVSDDIGRLPATIIAYPDPERRDVLTGMAIFLAFSTHFWGLEWLEQFGGITPKLDQVLRMIQHVSDDMVTNHSPISDLATVRRVLDDGAVTLGPRVEEIFAAAGLLDPATAADPAPLDITKYLEISPDRAATPPAVIVRHPELQTRVSQQMAAQET
jgi:hypothetical protein